MKVILKSDVQNLGKAGQIVKVKSGFARNFLFPRKLAQEATEKRIKELQHLMQVAQIKQKKLMRDKQKLLDTIAQTRLVIHAPTGQDSDKLFGTVTNADIASALENKGIVIDRKQIHIETPIKFLGEYQASVALGEDMKITLTISVEKETKKDESITS